MTVVADAGPLIALAKIGGLEALRLLFPKVLVPPAVFREAVELGLAAGEPDAKELSLYSSRGHLVVLAPSDPAPESLRHLGAGERESFALAMEYRADWLLIDDWQARQVGEREVQALGLPTRIRRTLGLLVAAHLAGVLTSAQVVELVQRIRQRPDIWISAALCDQVIASLNAARG